MNVTVADCLKLPTLREAQLIAGAKGTDRAVSSVSVLEWPETNLLSDELIVGNELIISALVTIKGDVARQCSVLRHLRSMGAAGLVLFYVGVFIPRIDEALIAVADEINLPLIAMPFGRLDFRYSDVITDVVEYIHNRRMHGNYYATELMNSIALLEPQQRNINTALRLAQVRHGVLGEHGQTEAREQLGDGVVDLGILMVGAPGQHDAARAARIGAAQQHGRFLINGTSMLCCKHCGSGESQQPGR